MPAARAGTGALRALHVRRSPMLRGLAQLRVYDAPPGALTNPRLLLQGTMPVPLADALVALLRVAAFARRVPYSEAGRTRP